MTNPSKKVVLITGCSKDSIGDPVAREFLKRNYHVIATARSLSRIEHLSELGIQIEELDITSPESITNLRQKITSLDILVNNAGGTHIMPFTDTSVSEFRRMMDLNFFSIVEMTQAFLPLLIERRGIVVNQGSQSSQINLPLCSAYAASKGAVARLTDCARMELEPFGVRVVYLCTAVVASNITIKGMRETPSKLPDGSLHAPVKAEMEAVMSGEPIWGREMNAEVYAKKMVGDLLDGGTPRWIWRGTSATITWWVWFLEGFWKGMWDPLMRRVGGLHLLEARLKAIEGKKNN